jgi:hypothetical protein
MSFSFLNAPKDNKELLMGDVVRVLSLLLGNLWFSELSSELNSFKLTLGRPVAFSKEELNESIKALIALNIVTARNGFRATFNRPEPDMLVGLINSNSLEAALSFDTDIRKYRMLSKF